jgi:hypothetical protein
MAALPRNSDVSFFAKTDVARAKSVTRNNAPYTNRRCDPQNVVRTLLC